MRILCYNIKFSEKASNISVCGSDALLRFMQQTDCNNSGQLPWSVDLSGSTENTKEVLVEIIEPAD